MFRRSLATGALLLAAADALSPAPASAQEFLRQRLLVHNFDAGLGSLGRRAGDAVASAIDRAKSRDLIVINRWDMLQELEKAGFNIDSVLLGSEIGDITRRHRADEYVMGRAISSGGRAVRLDGYLMLTRDSALKQPVATAELADLGAAAEAFGSEVVRARLQMIPVRRCENAMRAGKPAEAATAALEGIRAYPRAAIARACLLRAYVATGQSADTVLTVANTLVSIDSTSAYGWEAAANAYDALGDRQGAGKAWSMAVALQSSDADAVGRVVTALMRDGNSAIATPIITRAAAERPDDEHLAGLHWRVLLATEEWTNAAKVGVALRKLSPTYETQPDYFAKLASAYRNSNQPFQALATAAEGVSLHPDDAELYLVYTQLVVGESDSALVRGLARYPRNGKLLALDAQLKRKHGDLQGALESTRRAIAQDSGLVRGSLQLAQAFLDVGQADSALAVLVSGLNRAGDSAVLAQFTLARGNVLYRSANATTKRADFEMALKYLELSQRLAPSPSAGFLVGSAAFGVAQLAATELASAKSCVIATLAQDNLVIAEVQLAAHGVLAPDAAKQFLDYAAQLRPYVAQQVKTLCATAQPSR